MLNYQRFPTLRLQFKFGLYKIHFIQGSVETGFTEILVQVDFCF